MPASMPAGGTGLASGTRAMRKPAPVSITCSPSEATFSMTSYRGKRLNVQVSHPNRQPIFSAAGDPRAPGAAASGRAAHRARPAPAHRRRPSSKSCDDPWKSPSNPRYLPTSWISASPWLTMTPSSK